MSSTLSSRTGAASLDRPERRATWHWWGVTAGVLGLLANLFTDPAASLTPAQRIQGEDVVNLVSRGGYHAGAVAGFLAVACILVVAAGWRRWSESVDGDSLAVRVLPSALVAGAGAMIVGYGFKGLMAIYLPGGINQDEYPLSGLYSLFMMNDLAAFFAWWGVAVAAAAMTWIALRDALLPRWIGVVSALAAVVPLAFLVITGLTGFPGVITPLWLVIVSAGLALRRSTT